MSSSDRSAAEPRDGKTPSSSASSMHQFMLPRDANPAGSVHGGMIMKMVDEAGALAAMRHSNRRVVTISMDSMTFKSPVRVGHFLMLDARLTYVGRTSMEVVVRVSAEDAVAGVVTHTNSARLVYVALDTEGHPTPVPELVCETSEERDEFERGRLRQQTRVQAEA